MPAVEADAEGIAAQHMEDFGKCGFQPSRIIVIGDLATVTRAIVCEIRRIGQYEIDAASRQCLQDFDAITLQDRIRLLPADELFALLFIHFSSLFRVGICFLHPNEEAGPTRRELGANTWLVRADAGSNANDRRGFCDWRERVQAEARRGARHILCVITGLVGATQSRADRVSVGKANPGTVVTRKAMLASSELMVTRPRRVARRIPPRR